MVREISERQDRRKFPARCEKSPPRDQREFPARWEKSATRTDGGVEGVCILGVAGILNEMRTVESLWKGFLLV